MNRRNRTGHLPSHTPALQPPQVCRVIFLLGCLASTVTAQALESAAVDMRSAFIDLCGTIAPYCGVICFLAPLPTIYQISRGKTVGNYPLLPYSSMVCNCFVWVWDSERPTEGLGFQRGGLGVGFGLLRHLPKTLLSNGHQFTRNCIATF